LMHLLFFFLRQATLHINNQALTSLFLSSLFFCIFFHIQMRRKEKGKKRGKKRCRTDKQVAVRREWVVGKTAICLCLFNERALILWMCACMSNSREEEEKEK
jgi:hypothetical protein